MGYTHTDIALYVYRFMYRYTVLLYTTSTDRLCTHTCGAHTVLGSVVLLYDYTVVQSLHTCTVNLF